MEDYTEETGAPQLHQLFNHKPLISKGFVLYSSRKYKNDMSNDMSNVQKKTHDLYTKITHKEIVKYNFTELFMERSKAIEWIVILYLIAWQVIRVYPLLLSRSDLSN